MKKYRLSVIIPAYNAERTITRCIQSILSKEDDRVQILVIDDGSTDKTQKEIAKLAQVHKNIDYYRQKNQGVSAARNYGIMKADGDYIAFIDSDDYFVSNAIVDVLEVCDRFSPDIIRFEHYDEKGKIRIRRKINLPANKVVDIKSNETILNNIFLTNDYSGVTRGVYKAKNISTIKFDTNQLMGEDYLFSIAALMNSRKIFYLNKPLYVYVANENSVTRRFDVRHRISMLENAIIAHQKIEEYLKEKKTIPKFGEIYKSKRSIINLFKRYAREMNYSSYKKACERTVDNKIISAEIVKCEPLFSGHEQSLMRHLPSAYVVENVKKTIKKIREIL